MKENDRKEDKENNKGGESSNIKENADEENVGKYKKLEEELKETKDRMLRIAADFENYKRRTSNENNKAIEYGKIDVIKNILPALDEFELAIKALVNANQNDGTREMLKGFEMVYANLRESLRKVGLETISSNEKFDPNLHEILMTKESDKEYGEILEIIKNGYKLNGIVVRPASVIISAGKPNNENDFEN